MASFLPAYQLERKHEGYWVNNPADKGGETYAGVARNIHPNWSGFPVLDAYKKHLGRALKWNEIVPGMEPHVQAFYQNLWNSKNFSGFTSQELANMFYDFYVNSGGATKRVQQLLRDEFQAPIVVDGAFGPDTLATMNRQDPVKLYNAIKNARIQYYQAIVQRDPTQQTFLKGWLDRIHSFPTLTKTAIGIGGIITIAGLFFLGYKLVQHAKTKKT
jgi:lysozyme family protein